MTQPAHTAAALRRSPHASTSSAVRTSLSRSVLAVGILAGAVVLGHGRVASAQA